MRAGVRAALALALSLAGAPAPAAPLDAVTARGELRVGTTGDYRPFSYATQAGTLDGADIALARGLAERLGVRIVFVTTRWSDLLADFTAGRFDMAVGGISIRPDRAAAGAFSRPLETDGKRPVARCAEAGRFTSVAAIDRPEVRVIENRGGSNEAFARQRLTHARLAIEPDNQVVPAALAEGRADVFVTDGIEAELIARRFPGRLCVVPVPAPFTTESKAWLLPADPRFKAAVDAYLDQALADGTWQRALDRAMAP